ncbi:MAG: ATP-binding protein [Candidatus Methanoplasma sp.]|jgi:AAA+ ATPase superfamily predicted ATPase|nr:ATP-binding protein [Candidatus Methanoplasma sp.]
MVFIGRNKELKVLNDLYAEDGFKTFAMYGRRRVGKSSILRKFCTGKKSLFFVPGPYSESINLELFRDCILSLTGTLPRPYGNFIEAFKDMAEACGNERIVVVIDEYPFLVKSAPYVSSLLQAYIDHDLKETNMLLILCGSSMHAMANELLSGDAPLFGRFANRLEVKPLSYGECAEFHPGLSFDDNLRIYGAVGGMPLYHTMLGGDNHRENIMKNFVAAGAEMSEEARNVVLTELMPAKTYGSIVSAMSGGSTRVSVIADKAGVDPPLCSKCLNDMIFLGLVKKKVLLGNSKKTPAYVLSDNLLRFYGRIVERCMPLISSGRSEEACDLILDMFSTHMGLVFEDACAEFVGRRFPCVSVGTWIGSDPKTKTATDIDIAAEVFDGRGNYCLLAECKYSASKVGFDVLKSLESRAESVGGFDDKRLALFSRSGFEERLVEHAKNNGILLFTLDDLYG